MAGRSRWDVVVDVLVELPGALLAAAYVGAAAAGLIVVPVLVLLGR